MASANQGLNGAVAHRKGSCTALVVKHAIKPGP